MLGTFSKIWDLCENRHGVLVKALLLSFLRTSFGVTQLIAIILTIRTLLGDADAHTSVIWIIALTVICIIGSFVTSYVEQISSLETGMYMTADKRVSVGNYLRKVPLGYFNDISAGKITSTLTTTLSGVEMAATMSVIGIISGLFNSFIMFIFMLVYDWRIGLATGAGMVLYLIVVSWQMKVSRKNAPMLQKAQRSLTEHVLVFLRGIRVIKAFSFKNADSQVKEAIQGSCDGNIGLTNKSMPSQFAAHLTIAVAEAVLFVMALTFYFVSGDITAEKAVVLIIFSFMAYAFLNQSGSMLSMIGLLDSGIAEVDEIEEAEQMEEKQPLQKADSNEIVFDHVSFSYGTNEVLHDISTVIRPNTFTAVIGPSGSGKTTLCQLIPRFRDVCAGKIMIGGADVRHMKYEELMKKISMVFQNVYLFEDTIMNNIRFGKPDATYEEVRKAAKAAQCDEFIMALPDGYDTVVDEGGTSLSGGEKQRISIARAMLKDSPIIILDEATSALDAENEHEILSAIDELTKNKTVIMIAHRIKSVQKADHIIAVKDGKIVQEGTHEELIKEKGLYADFINLREKAGGWKLANS